MRAVLLSGQGKDVRFVNQHDRVHDQPTPRHYQQKTPPPPRPQEIIKTQGNPIVSKETIPIKMVERKDWFQVDAFLDTPIILPMW